MVIPDWPAEHIDAPALDPVPHHAYRVRTSETTTTHTVMNVVTIEEVPMEEILSANAPSHQGPEVAARAERILHYLVEGTAVLVTGLLRLVAVEVRITSKLS